MGAVVRRALGGQEARALNVISHFLKHVPYKNLPAAKVKLGKRRIGRYKAVDYPFKFVPEVF